MQRSAIALCLGIAQHKTGRDILLCLISTRRARLSTGNQLDLPQVAQGPVASLKSYSREVVNDGIGLHMGKVINLRFTGQTHRFEEVYFYS